MKDDEEEGEKDQCKMDGIGKGEEKEREDSIRTQISTNIYRLAIKKLQYSMWCSIKRTTEREEEILYREDYSKWKTRLKADTHNPAANFSNIERLFSERRR